MQIFRIIDRRRWLRGTWEIAKGVRRQWEKDRVPGVSAEIAFWLVLSIFPGLLIVAALLGWVEGVLGAGVAQDAEDRIIEELDSLLGAQGGVTVDAARDLFRGTNPGVLTFGAAAAVVSASRGFAAIVRALDVAYNIDEYRSWIHTRVTALGLALGTLLIGTFMLVMLVVGPLSGPGSEIAENLGVGGWFETFWRWGRLPSVFVVVIAWATTIYHIAPLHHSPWRWDVPGAAIAAVSWLGATLGFRLYLGTIGDGNAIFGAVGGMLSLLLWVYLLSVGLLIGAEVNQVLAQRYGVRFVAGGSVRLTERVRAARGIIDRRRARRRYGREE